MRPVVFLALVAVSIGLFAFPSTAVQEDTAVGSPFGPYISITGADSAIEKPGYFRVESMKEWIALWLSHKGAGKNPDYGMFYNPAGVPEIDFDTCMVVAVFGGRCWNSAGFRIESGFAGESRVLVRFDHKSYQTKGPDGGGERVTPYGFFVFPATDKPVILEENVQGLIGGEPIWKERARL